MPGQSEILAHIDGASRGNPGPAAYAVVMKSAEGSRLAAFSKFLGEVTNNVAEYRALVAALEYALGHQHLRLRVRTDSELMARQISGRYKVKSPDLKPLYERARELIDQFEAFSIQHVLREQNREADRLVNQALDAAERSGSSPVSQGTDRQPLRVSATHRKGILKLHQQVPLSDGEEVELEIYRKR